jgi:hypothetical protein
MGCIYRIYCRATGKSYIGQTAYSHPFERFREHKNNARNNVSGPLYDDLRMYDIHEFECICIRVAPNEQLNDLECYYAEMYDAYVWNGGYNKQECGNAVVARELDDDTRLRKKRWMFMKRHLKNS